MRSETLKALSRREVITFKREKIDSAELLVNTILGQRNLVPLSKTIFPKLMQYEASLELFSLPDVVILCDNFVKFDRMFKKGCWFLTVSSFGTSNQFIEVDFAKSFDLAVPDGKDWFNVLDSNQ